MMLEPSTLDVLRSDAHSSREFAAGIGPLLFFYDALQ
jgi:hypothetical protein